MSLQIRKQAMHIPSIILASASPRRAELLREAGVKFEVVVSPAEEPERKPGGVPTEIWPMCLAYMKAKAVREHVGGRKGTGSKRKVEGRVILAADTIVVEGERILNKARDRGHARQMLLGLQGKTHRVITGICLMQGERVRLATAEAVCRVKRMSRAWLEEYLDSGLWKGKAGAYGIQDEGDPFVELVRGEFTAVVGLPMGLVQSELASF
jgi:septum formation protein